MFDFLFQKKNKEMQSMAEIITLDLEKLNLSKLAIEKAVMMIASNNSPITNSVVPIIVNAKSIPYTIKSIPDILFSYSASDRSHSSHLLCSSLHGLYSHFSFLFLQ